MARLQCPHCRAALEVPGMPPAGQSVRCPMCNRVFAAAVPLNPPDEDENDQEDDEEEEDRPRRKLKKKKKQRPKTPLWLTIVGAVLCLAVIGASLAIMFAKRTPEAAEEPKLERRR